MYAFFTHLQGLQKIEWANRKKNHLIVNEIHIKNNMQNVNYWLRPFFEQLPHTKKFKTKQNPKYIGEVLEYILILILTYVLDG